MRAWEGGRKGRVEREPQRWEKANGDERAKEGARAEKMDRAKEEGDGGGEREESVSE